MELNTFKLLVEIIGTLVCCFLLSVSTEYFVKTIIRKSRIYFFHLHAHYVSSYKGGDIVQVYDARADTINVDDITPRTKNRIVMRRIKSNKASAWNDVPSYNERILRINGYRPYWMQNYDYSDADEDDEMVDYRPKGAYDIGWLGYFIGQNGILEKLIISSFLPTFGGANVREVLQSFCKGVNRNKSIQEICFDYTNLLGGEIFTMLSPFFKNNYNLTKIKIRECDFGNEGASLLALALENSTNKSLQEVNLANNNITEEGMVDVIKALSMHSQLQTLCLGENGNSFVRGSSDKSIREICLGGVDLSGGQIFTVLGPFFQTNHNLTRVQFWHCNFGDEGGRLFALALRNWTHESLQKVELEDNNITEEGMLDIITSLNIFPHLEHLVLKRNRLSKNGSVALATLLQCSATQLKYLCISDNEINDECIEALVPALMNYSHLKQLDLENNSLITTQGWQSLATILEAPHSNLQRLSIPRNNTDDESMAAFASALANNRTLEALIMSYNPSITNIGWEAFSKALCNTSSVNSTFLSNHTLQSVGYIGGDRNRAIQLLLDLNQRHDNKEVAMIKILRSHEDFDMQPFFEWEFKVLPFVVNWFERASEYDFELNVERRKLSSIYQFVRAMPVLYVENRLRMELEDTKEELARLDQLKLLQLGRQQSIMKRLGRTF